MKYEYHEAARRELEESCQWYDQQSRGLAAELIQEVEQAVERILAGPETHAIFDGDIRRCPVKRFPYHLLYRVKGSIIEIICVMHTRRRPGYWKGRLAQGENPKNEDA